MNERIHYIDPMGGFSSTACGLSRSGRKITSDLETCTCKVCLKITTEGHR